MITLKQLNLGKIDGKHEYLSPKNERDELFFDAFLVPDNLDVTRIRNSDISFIQGFRGTGKTSLLRWFAEQKRSNEALTDFILFKSDLTEQQRLTLSTEVGVSWHDVDSSKMEISQDFKSAWMWFIFHKLGELFCAEFEVANDPNMERFIRLLGIGDQSTYNKVLGFLPKLEGAKVSLKSDLNFFEIELSGEMSRKGDTAKTTLEALNRRLAVLLKKIDIGKTLYLFFDELEVFFHSSDQYKRDQCMVRDLIFSINTVNELMHDFDKPIHLVCAVRSEVVSGFGSVGQEVERIIHDKGFNIAWHFATRSKEHPLLKMIARKINASEKAHGAPVSENPIDKYFPRNFDENPIDVYLLDRSFYKPRDIVWRLSIAQKQFPDARKFTHQVLSQSEIEYSSRIWNEVTYELSAVYSNDEILFIEQALSGASPLFSFEDVVFRFDEKCKFSRVGEQLLKRRSVSELLHDLYRLGAIGNSFRVGTTGTDIRNRWSFRGDPSLLIDKKMMLHQALHKRLSAVRPRKRGSRTRDRRTDRSYL